MKNKGLNLDNDNLNATKSDFNATKKDGYNPNFIETSDLVNKMKSEKIKAKGASNEAQLLRMSLNVKKNILKENSDYLGIIDNKDVKLQNIDEVIYF